MENLEEYVQDSNVTVEVLPEEITEVVYLSSPDHKQDLLQCEINVDEDATLETEDVVIPSDADTYVVLATENTDCEVHLDPVIFCISLLNIFNASRIYTWKICNTAFISWITRQKMKTSL